MYAGLKSTAQNILDFILPLRCPVSGEAVDHHGALSGPAWAGLEFIEPPFCRACSFPFDYSADDIITDLLCAGCTQTPPLFDKARARLIYNDTSRALLLKFKHGDQMQIAYSLLPFLRQAADDFLPKTDLILPVPLHPKRLLKRKYNQAAILAQILARESGKPYHPDILIRSKHTQQQQGDATTRQKNVRNAFAVQDKYAYLLSGKVILLIDDVYTTGSTVNACAQTLRKAGAEQIFVAVCARVKK